MIFPDDDCPRDCTKCKRSESEKNSCDSIDGRYLERVNEYASTCDGCGEMTSHELMCMDLETQFGYCFYCVRKDPALQEKLRAQGELKEEALEV